MDGSWIPIQNLPCMTLCVSVVTLFSPTCSRLKTKKQKKQKQLLRLEYFHTRSLLLTFPAFQNGWRSTESSFEMMATIYLSQAGSETGLLSNTKMPLVEIYSSCPDELQTWLLLEWGEVDWRRILKKNNPFDLPAQLFTQFSSSFPWRLKKINCFFQM